MKFTRKILIIIVILSLAAGFGGGILFIQYKTAGTDDSLDFVKQLINQEAGQPDKVDFSLFWDAWNALNKKYVNRNKINTQDLVYGAIKGMVNSLDDPYTVFFEPESSKKFQEVISGAFGGVGIEIGKRNNTLTVIAPIKNTPAFRAGIKSGDKIIKIDSKSTADMPVDEAVNLIRGKPGTKVTLTISNGDTKPIELTRETIKIPTVEWQMLEKNNKRIAFLQIFAFNQNVDSEFKQAAEEILKSGADSLIIDLRNNPGGLLDSAINLAGWFLNRNKTVTIEEFADGTRNEFVSDGNGALKTYPTVLLINNGSASASEILSGALHDNMGIKLVGEKTFGKGSVQELEKFSDGSSLKVTIAKWLTPSGISISEKGIEPDIKVEIPAKDIEENKFELGVPDKDPQLDKAIDLLR